MTDKSLHIETEGARLKVTPESDIGKQTVQIAKEVARGETPGNVELKSVVETARDTLQQQAAFARQEPGSTQRAEAILWDTDKLLKDMEKLLDEKNSDEQLQRMAVLARAAMTEYRRRLDIDTQRQRMQKASEEIQETMPRAQSLALDLGNNIRVFGKDLLLDSSFRELLSDTMQLFSEMFQTIRPEVEQAKEEVKEEVKGKAEETDREMQKKGKVSTEVAKEKVKESAEQVKESGKKAAQAIKAKTVEKSSEGGSELTERETREKWIAHYTELLQKIGANKDYRRAMANLNQLLNYMRGVLGPVLDTVGMNFSMETPGGKEKEGKVEGEKVVEPLKWTNWESVRTERLPANYALWKEFRSFMERLSGESLEGFVQAWNDLFDVMSKDKEVRSLLGDVWDYFTSRLQHPEQAEQNKESLILGEFYDRAARVRDRSGRMWSDRWERLSGEWARIVEGIRSDPAVQRLDSDLRKLGQKLLYDEQGNVSLDILRESLQQMRTIVSPSVMAELKYMQLPAVEGETRDGKYWFRVRDAVFQAVDLLPDKLYWEMASRGEVALNELTTAGRTRLLFQVRNLDAHVLNCNFEYKRHGTISLEDSGLLDVHLSGLTVTTILRLSHKHGRMPKLVAENTDAHIDKLRIEIKEATKHKILDKLGAAIFQGSFKRMIENELENRLGNQLDNFARTINRAINANTVTSWSVESQKARITAQETLVRGVERAPEKVPAEKIAEEREKLSKEVVRPAH